MSKADIIFKNFVWSYELNKTTRFVSDKKEESYQVLLIMNGLYGEESKSQYIIHVSKEDYEALENTSNENTTQVDNLKDFFNDLSLDDLKDLRRDINEKIALKTTLKEMDNNESSNKERGDDLLTK